MVPEFHNLGIEVALIMKFREALLRGGQFTQNELAWIGDFNPKMLNVGYSLGDVFQSRKLTTYRYLFDRTKEFKRHPILS